MAELRPYPFGALIRRAFRELEERDSIFDLPRRKFHTPPPDLDLSVRFHGLPASTPLGPAAGPHSQMAQNIVLGWLAGCRIIELKTVQVRDDLEIPRPCIDMQTVGYNVEWSQELKLEESLEEYVKAAMLIEILKASGLGGGDVVYDMSVGYDLEGIRSQRVQAFMRGMRQARPLVERLRAQIPAEHSRFRDLDFPTCISRSVTLSTFHGCPPHEIEKIAEFLLEQGLACVVKLNPLLLGREQLESLLQTHLGYSELRVPEEAYGRDTTWPQA
ncbi:MAG TPA: glutamate synthase, partial [Candidatus Nitrosotenuis sp.]|nr:glutamate synthase [Candidatus Nitrosotenuis sp.]